MMPSLRVGLACSLAVQISLSADAVVGLALHPKQHCICGRQSPCVGLGLFTKKKK